MKNPGFPASHVLQHLILNIFFFSINDSWLTQSHRKKLVFPEMNLKFLWLVFSTSPQPQLYFLLASVAVSETEEKYGLPYLLIGSQRYFLALVSAFHSLRICMVQFLMTSYLGYSSLKWCETPRSVLLTVGYENGTPVEWGSAQPVQPYIRGS